MGCSGLGKNRNFRDTLYLFRKYRSLCSSDPWFITILNNIKRNIPGVYDNLR